LRQAFFSCYSAQETADLKTMVLYFYISDGQGAFISRRSNLFLYYYEIFYPKTRCMALSPDDSDLQWPLPVYDFKVEINGEVIAFSEVFGLNKSFETIVYRESKTDQPGGGPVIMYMPGHTQPVHLSMRKGIGSAQSLMVLYKWISSTRINQVEKKDIKIQLNNEDGTAEVTWMVINAFPVKLDAPTFDDQSSEVAIVQLDLMASDLFIEEN
jgi:phage tail-like protein